MEENKEEQWKNGKFFVQFSAKNQNKASFFLAHLSPTNLVC